jgi:hypothetical protein
VSRHEEKAFPVGKTKPNHNLKGQLARLKDDLAQFLARKPSAAVLEPLRKRISDLEAEIAAETERAQGTARAEKEFHRDDARGEGAGSSIRLDTGRFPPRRH